MASASPVTESTQGNVWHTELALKSILEISPALALLQIPLTTVLLAHGAPSRSTLPRKPKWKTSSKARDPTRCRSVLSWCCVTCTHGQEVQDAWAVRVCILITKILTQSGIFLEHKGVLFFGGRCFLFIFWGGLFFIYVHFI